jgi:hypothetical protein
VSSLGQHSAKNKTRQLDLFANDEVERTDDAAPAGTAPAHDPLAGLAVKLEHDRCRCGSDTAIVGAGNP